MMNGSKAVLLVLLVIMAVALAINAIALLWTARNQNRIILNAFEGLTR